MKLVGTIPAGRVWDVVDHLSRQGVRVVAPTLVDGLCQFAPVTGAHQVVKDYLLPQNTFKEFLFPKQERVFTWLRRDDGSYVVTEPPRDFPETVILGGRPCDAAAIGVSLKSVFSASASDRWEHADPLFLERFERTTVVCISCDRPDLSCFCTTMGLGPDDPTGSDVLITASGPDGDLVVEVFSPKGERFVERIRPLLITGQSESLLREQRLAAGQEARGRFVRVFDIGQVKAFLDNPENFDDELFQRLGTKCVSCGVCTFECPTCHCFDFKDLGDTTGGERIKVWDSCQFPAFTVHATGHQPRPTQWERYRNRFLCKFKIYEDVFETLGCTGCGRCVRDCPVHVDITSYAMQSHARQVTLLQLKA
ncbi:MAG: 4Fe-4S dicluster domain-containing protein [Nitrospirota bacterium]|nr:4Fe-4S dicluster domain-containing protein [Nitrospirota bacterium]